MFSVAEILPRFVLDRHLGFLTVPKGRLSKGGKCWAFGQFGWYLPPPPFSLVFITTWSLKPSYLQEGRSACSGVGMCCTLVVRYRSSSATNLGRTNRKIRVIVLVLLPCSILSQNTGKRRKQSSWERLAGDAPAGKAARAREVWWLDGCHRWSNWSLPARNGQHPE